MDYDGFERVYLPYLKDNLDSKLFYHSYDHTIDVLNASKQILQYEIIIGESAELVKTAAMLHDSGFIHVNVDHELKSVEVAKEWLPGYDYTPKQIETVTRLILATIVGKEPQDKLEQVMCDADMDYLGTDRYGEVAILLLKELREQGQTITDEEWKQIQIDFLTKHKYYTSFSIEFRKDKKEDNLQKLLNSFSFKT